MRLNACAALLASLIVLATGCNQSPVAPSQTPATVSTAATAGPATSGEGTQLSGMKGHDVPFAGAVTGQLQMSVNPARCALPLRFGVSNAVGNALHMGNVTYHTEQCVNPMNGQVTSGVLVLTAANGDELRGTFSGQSHSSVPGESHVEADFVFSGGTGRFEQATGDARMTAVLDVHLGVPPFPGRWEWTGAIRY
jgi:hypothetical protein